MGGLTSSSSLRARRGARIRRAGALALLLALALLVLAAEASAYSGQRLWIAKYGTFSRPAGCWDMATGPRGASCAVGWTSPSFAHGSDVLVIKYDAGGHQKWLRTYNGAASDEDVAWAVEFDRAGNIYVGGMSKGRTTQDDFFVAKYSPSGKRLWAKRYDGPAHGDDRLWSLKVTGAGTVYVMGNSYVDGQPRAIVVAKYSSAGVKQWVTRHVPPADPDAGKMEGYDMALDGAGNAWVTGYSTYLAVREAITLKFASADGSKAAGDVYSAPGAGETRGVAVEARADRVVVAGWATEGDKTSTVVLWYDLAGTRVKDYPYVRDDGAENSPDNLAIDQAGNVYLAGTAWSSAEPSWHGCQTLKFTAAGEPAWPQPPTYQPAGTNVWGDDIVVDALGNAYILGRIERATTGEDILIMKYSSDGAPSWAKPRIWTGPGNRDDDPASIALGGTSGLYVGAQGYAKYGNPQSVVIKYQR